MSDQSLWGGPWDILLHKALKGRFDPAKHPRAQRGRFRETPDQPEKRKETRTEDAARKPQANDKQKGMPKPIKARQAAQQMGFGNLDQRQQYANFAALQTGFDVLRGFGARPLGMAIYQEAQKARRPMGGLPSRQPKAVTKQPERQEQQPARSRSVFYRVDDARKLRGKQIPQAKLTSLAKEPVTIYASDERQTLVAKPNGSGATFEDAQVSAKPRFFTLRY